MPFFREKSKKLYPGAGLLPKERKIGQEKQKKKHSEEEMKTEIRKDCHGKFSTVLLCHGNISRCYPVLLFLQPIYPVS